MLFSFLFVVIAAVTLNRCNGETAQFDLAKHCNGEHIVIRTAGVLTLYKNTLTISSCNVTVESQWMGDLGRPSFLRLQIRSLYAPCKHRASLQLFNGQPQDINTTRVSYPGNICTSDGGHDYKAMYLILGNILVLNLNVDSPTEEEIFMELLATATAFSPDDREGLFLCRDNNLYVPSSLTCDGNNNCGDGSDEGYEMCDKSHRIYFIATIVLAAVLGVVVVVAVVVCIVYKIKRRRQGDNPEETGRLVGGSTRSLVESYDNDRESHVRHSLQ